ncbi:MAG: hypothetical protein ABII25_03590 [bacterium]
MGKKEHVFNLISLFLSIIIAGSLFSGLGRFISGANLLTGITDGFFISLAVFFSLYLSTIPFFNRFKLPQYSIISFLIIGFFIGGIPGIIVNDKLVFFTSGISGGLFCLPFVRAEKHLAFYLLAGMVLGFLSYSISNVSVGLSLLNSINIKIIFLGALYGAIWGGLIILGIKLSMLYLKPLIKIIIPHVLISLFYGLAIAGVVGFAGFLAAKIVPKFSMSVLSPLTGLLLVIGIGFIITVCKLIFAFYLDKKQL